MVAARPDGVDDERAKISAVQVVAALGFGVGGIGTLTTRCPECLGAEASCDVCAVRESWNGNASAETRTAKSPLTCCQAPGFPAGGPGPGVTLPCDHRAAIDSPGAMAAPTS